MKAQIVMPELHRSYARRLLFALSPEKEPELFKLLFRLCCMVCYNVLRYGTDMAQIWHRLITVSATVLVSLCYMCYKKLRKFCEKKYETAGVRIRVQRKKYKSLPKRYGTYGTGKLKRCHYCVKAVLYLTNRNGTYGTDIAQAMS